MRTWIAALSLALSLALTAPAHAAGPRKRPPLPDEIPADFDAHAESYSDFWEQALRPYAKEYESKVRTAEVELASIGRVGKRLRRAERLLKQAIELEPDTPDAYWWLGRTYELEERWRDCADQRQKVFDLHPGFAPPNIRKPVGWELDLKLGECLALAGDYEGAISHYRRILTSGKTHHSFAHVHLAMAYMALGRINDAIDTYEEAMVDRETNPQQIRRLSFMYFGAAVAYDRDEQIGRSKELLDLALRYDRALSAFADPKNRFLFPEDEHYFRGLAESANPRRRAFAIAYFRRYAQVASETGWIRRAEDHLDELVGRQFGADDVIIRGAGVIDSKKTRAAVVKKIHDLHACLDKSPHLLFRVAITKLATGSAGPKKRKPIGPPRNGVRVRQELAFDTATRDVLSAQACVTEAARDIKLPKVIGSLNSYATVEFLIIAH